MVQKESTQLEKSPPTWSFLVISALGFWLLTAPAAFQFENGPLVISDMVCGALLIILSLLSRKNPKQLIQWALALIGIWIQFAPLLYWAPVASSYLTNILIGSLVIVFSVVLFPLPGELKNDEPTVPPGFSYNPSSFSQRLPIAILVFICWTISRYLATYQLGYHTTLWDPFFSPGTKAVIESSISKDFPVSDAGLGALAYTIEFFSTCQGGKARWRTAPWLVLIFGMLVIPVGLVSMTLVILQPLVVGTWCTLCLVTATCMLLMIPLAIDEVIASLQFLHKNGWRYLFSGKECMDATEDQKTPTMESSLWAHLKTGLWGVSAPWNLIISALLGIYLMAAPAIFHIKGILFDLDPILGAFITAVSVISFAKRLRFFRWSILLFALILAVVAVTSKELIVFHLIFALIAALLSIRSGLKSQDPLL